MSNEVRMVTGTMTVSTVEQEISGDLLTSFVTEFSLEGVKKLLAAINAVISSILSVFIT